MKILKNILRKNAEVHVGVGILSTRAESKGVVDIALVPTDFSQRATELAEKWQTMKKIIKKDAPGELHKHWSKLAEHYSKRKSLPVVKK